ncbi:unnamed protein product [Boreogadus saida]
MEEENRLIYLKNKKKIIRDIVAPCVLRPPGSQSRDTGLPTSLSTDGEASLEQPQHTHTHTHVHAHTRTRTRLTEGRDRVPGDPTCSNTTDSWLLLNTGGGKDMDGWRFVFGGTTALLGGRGGLLPEVCSLVVAIPSRPKEDPNNDKKKRQRQIDKIYKKPKRSVTHSTRGAEAVVRR